MSQGINLKAFSFLILCKDTGDMSKEFTQLFEGKIKTLYRADSITEWLKLYVKHKPDILFGEYALLNQQEFAGVKKLRQHNTSIPIVFYFYEDEEAEAAEIAAFGNCFFLSHPIQVDLLKEVLTTASRNIMRERTCIARAHKSNRVLDTLPQLVCVSNREGDLIDANHKFLSFFGAENLDEFKQKHPKMNRVFVPKKDCLKPTESENWVDFVLDRPLGRRKVCFHDANNNEAIFQALVDYYGLENPEYVFSFSDMTAEDTIFREMLAEYQSDVRPKVYSWKIVSEQINREVHRAKRYKNSFSLIVLCMVDETGDHKLLDKRDDNTFAIVEKIIHKTIRPTDYMGKWENNRYVILTAHTDTEGSRVLISRIEKECLNYSMIKQLRYRFKFGIAQYQEGDTATNLLKRSQNMLTITLKKPELNIMSDQMIQ